MASKVHVELNRAEVGKLLKSAEIMSFCQSVAEQKAAQMGSSYKTSAYVGPKRVNVSVYTEDPAAIRDNLENNTMLKGLG